MLDPCWAPDSPWKGFKSLKCRNNNNKIWLIKGSG